MIASACCNCRPRRAVCRLACASSAAKGFRAAALGPRLAGVSPPRAPLSRCRRQSVRVDEYKPCITANGLRTAPGSTPGSITARCDPHWPSSRPLQPTRYSRWPDPSAPRKQPSTNGTNMKNSPHENLTQPLHKALDQGLEFEIAIGPFAPDMAVRPVHRASGLDHMKLKIDRLPPHEPDTERVAETGRDRAPPVSRARRWHSALRAPT